MTADVTVEDLKKKLVRRASRAVVGGFRPPADPLASWFGRVNVALPGEDWPTSAARPMMPLCQFNLIVTLREWVGGGGYSFLPGRRFKSIMCGIRDPGESRLGTVSGVPATDGIPSRH